MNYIFKRDFFCSYQNGRQNLFGPEGEQKLVQFKCKGFGCNYQIFKKEA